MRETDPGRAPETPPLVVDGELPLAVRVIDLTLGRDPAFFHGEHVREVSIDVELDSAEPWRFGKVADVDVLAHSAADVAMTRDEQL